MLTLEKSNLKTTVSEIITKNIELFNLFNNVYLFGSSLYKSPQESDVDLLLVYSCPAGLAVKEMRKIREALGSKLKVPIDLTVLSVEELKTTEFLKKIVKYLKIK